MSPVVELASWDDGELLGNVWIRTITYQRGQIIPGHKHNFPHASAVVRGAITLRLKYDDGRIVERQYAAPSRFEIPADCYHEMQGLSDGAQSWCIFAVRDPDGKIAEHVRESHKEDRFYHEALGHGDRA